MEKQDSSIFNFKKFYLFIGTLLFLLISCGLPIHYFFEQKIIFAGEISGASKINRLLYQNNENEIPIFGSSRAQGSFVPSILGNQYFNYGIDATQANVWIYFLEEELKKQKNTPIIINFDWVGLINQSGDIGNYIPHYSVLEQLEPTQAAFFYQIPFLKYFGYYELYFKYYLNEKLNFTKITDKGGSFEKGKLTKEKFEELIQQRALSKESFFVDKTLNAKLEKLIQSTDRKLFFVIVPYHSSYIKQFENREQCDSFIANLSKNKNVYIIDFSEKIKADSLFMNTTHLNYEGAKIFSQQLKNEIAKTKK